MKKVIGYWAVILRPTWPNMTSPKPSKSPHRTASKRRRRLSFLLFLSLLLPSQSRQCLKFLTGRHQLTPGTSKICRPRPSLLYGALCMESDACATSVPTSLQGGGPSPHRLRRFSHVLKHLQCATGWHQKRYELHSSSSPCPWSMLPYCHLCSTGRAWSTT